MQYACVLSKAVIKQIWVCLNFKNKQTSMDTRQKTHLKVAELLIQFKWYKQLNQLKWWNQLHQINLNQLNQMKISKLSKREPIERVETAITIQEPDFSRTCEFQRMM